MDESGLAAARHPVADTASTGQSGPLPGGAMAGSFFGVMAGCESLLAGVA